MALDSLIEMVSSDLNDNAAGHENTTWSTAQISGWLAEAMSLIFDKRPDLFMERVTLKVASCSIIQDTCDCDKIRRVIGQVTESGRLLSPPLRERTLELAFQWTGKPCRKQSTKDFRLDSYAIDTVSETLYLWPEVPPDVDVWIQVECAHRPTAEEIESGEYTLPEDTHVAAVQWALWRAKSMDMEISGGARAAAQRHYKAFFDILGVSAETTLVVHKREAT